MLDFGDDVTPRDQKGEEAMETSKPPKKIDRTTACMKRPDINTKGCGQLTSNDTHFADIWFSSVKNAEDMAAAGVDYDRPAKTIHKGFCLDKLENLMKDWPKGSYIVMKSYIEFPVESPHLVIGYKYISSKVLGVLKY